MQYRSANLARFQNILWVFHDFVTCFSSLRLAVYSGIESGSMSSSVSSRYCGRFHPNIPAWNMEYMSCSYLGNNKLQAM